MCCPRPGAEFRWMFSDLAERSARKNSEARTTIFDDEAVPAVLRRDAVTPAMELPPRARLSPRIRSDRQAAELGCWWARESSRRLRPDSAREHPRVVHEERL